MVIWKKPRPVDRHVQAAAGLQHAALRVVLFGGDDAHAGAEREAGRVLRVLRALRADLPDVLVQQILERRAAGLEAGRVGVGEVVGDDRHLRVLRVETGLGGP